MTTKIIKREYYHNKQHCKSGSESETNTFETMHAKNKTKKSQSNYRSSRLP